MTCIARLAAQLLILAAPMVALYILSIFIAWVFGPVAKKKDEADPSDLQDP